MALKVYNTLSRSLEEFKPLRGNRVRMFVCGPTVYDFSHIGHARTYLAYDIIARYLRARGYSVFYMVNITDIDDKIIKRANASGEDPLEMADKFSKEFFNDMERLAITGVNLYPKASEHIPEIIAQVSMLIEKGYAYQVGGDVYFDVSKFPDYGELSGQDIQQLTVHRIDPDPRKKSVVDFALWKTQKPGEPSWDSPWGKGRPGWHIEDTAITTTYFGPQYDLHGGGLDLVFPHHEAEIAQAEAATGVEPLVKYWLHGGLLTVSGARMGKSMGNFITIKEAVREHDAEAFRLYYAMSHYRSQLEFDEANISQAEQVLNKLRAVYSQFTNLYSRGNLRDVPQDDAKIEKMSKRYRDDFNNAMDEDFNTPKALAAIIAFSKEAEAASQKEMGKQAVLAIITTFDYFGSVFGIFQQKTTDHIAGSLGQLVDLILDIRQNARGKGDWATSDRIRDELQKAGIEVEDSPSGARWHFTAKRPN